MTDQEIIDIVKRVMLEDIGAWLSAALVNLEGNEDPEFLEICDEYFKHDLSRVAISVIQSLIDRLSPWLYVSYHSLNSCDQYAACCARIYNYSTLSVREEIGCLKLEPLVGRFDRSGKLCQRK